MNQKILIVHTWGIGDLVLLTPVLELLHYLYPDLVLDFAIFQPASISPIKLAPYLGKIFSCSYKPLALLKQSRIIKNQKYDLCIVTSGTDPLKAALFLFLIKARTIIGEYRSIKNPIYTRQNKFNDSILRTWSDLHIFQQFFKLPVRQVIENDKNLSEVFKTRFYMAKSSEEIAASFFTKHFGKQTESSLITITEKKLVAIHPGCNAKNSYRRWPKEYFVSLINKLKEHYPTWSFYIIAGPDEIQEGEYLQRTLGIPILRDVSLEVVALALARSHILINTDSGIGHIASCFKIRTYTIFGPGDERQTAPFNPLAKVIRQPISCAPCVGKSRQKCQAECLQNLKPETVEKFILMDYPPSL